MSKVEAAEKNIELTSILKEAERTINEIDIKMKDIEDKLFSINSTKEFEALQKEAGDLKRKKLESEELLLRRVEALEFSARTLNCFDKANIETLGDLIKLTEDDLLNLEHFGKRSLYEVRDKLNPFINLHLRVSSYTESINKYSEKEKLAKLVDSRAFSTRTLNCFSKANIETLGDLIKLTEDDLLNLEDFGKRSLYEVRDILKNYPFGPNIKINNIFTINTKIDDINEIESKIEELKIDIAKTTAYPFQIIIDYQDSCYSSIIRDERQKYILLNRALSFEKKMTLLDIGSKFKITRERVRQIEKKISLKNSINESFLNLSKTKKNRDYELEYSDTVIYLINLYIKYRKFPTSGSADYKRVSLVRKKIFQVIEKIEPDVLFGEGQVEGLSRDELYLIRNLNYIFETSKYLPIPFNYRYYQLKKFLDENNREPKSQRGESSLTAEGHLAKYLTSIRGKRLIISPEQENMIESLGVSLSTRKAKWDTLFAKNYQKLQEFIETNKRKPQSCNSEDEKKLYYFVIGNKQQISHGRKRERVPLFEKLGYSFGKTNTSLKDRLKEIDDFFKKKNYKLERKKGYLAGLKATRRNFIYRIYHTINGDNNSRGTTVSTKTIDELKNNYYNLYINLKKIAFQISVSEE
jgi:hypothetical protein